MPSDLFLDDLGVEVGTNVQSDIFTYSAEQCFRGKATNEGHDRCDELHKTPKVHIFAHLVVVVEVVQNREKVFHDQSSKGCRDQSFDNFEEKAEENNPHWSVVLGKFLSEDSFLSFGISDAIKQLQFAKLFV